MKPVFEIQLVSKKDAAFMSLFGHEDQVRIVPNATVDRSSVPGKTAPVLQYQCIVSCEYTADPLGVVVDSFRFFITFLGALRPLTLSSTAFSQVAPGRIHFHLCALSCLVELDDSSPLDTRIGTCGFLSKYKSQLIGYG